MLIAHYPLDNDANDISGFGNHGTESGSPTTVDGRIGKCFDFDGTDDWVDIGNLGHPGEGSISLWFNKPNIQAGAQYFLEGRTSGNWYLLQDYNGYAINFVNKVMVAYSDVNANTWYHVVITANINETKIYLNGELKDTSSGLDIDFSSVRIGTRYTNVNYFDGMMDDVRIYNHALSLKEIKELYKAEALHYSFNNFAESTENLFRKTDFLIGGTKPYRIYSSGGTTEGGHLDPFGTNNAVKFTSGGVNLRYGEIDGSNPDMPAGETYTFSFYAKLVPGAAELTQAHFDIVDRGGTGILSSLTAKWQRFSTTALHDNNANYAFVDIFINSGGEILLSHPQIERKDHKTPFVDGTRNDSVFDSSGYGNHASLGTITSPEWVEESVLGSGSYKFNGSTKIDLSPIVLPFTEWSLPFWFKSSNVSKHIHFTGVTSTHSGGWSPLSHFGHRGGVLSWWDSNGWTDGTTSLVNDEWYFAVIQNTGSEIQMYLNGEIESNGVTPVNGVAHISAIGYRRHNNDRFFEGIISDVRLYNTSFTQQEIQDMYKQRVSLDDKGTLHTVEISELNNWQEDIQSTNLIENGRQEYGDLYNFTSFHDFTSLGEHGYFSVTGTSNVTVQSDNLIKVNALEGDMYDIVGDFITLGPEQGRLYYGLACYDKNKQFIGHTQVHHYITTETTLSQDLNTNDTVVHLTNVSNDWRDSTGPVSQRYLGFWGDLSEYATYTYTREVTTFADSDSSANTVTLNSPWSWGTVASGTPVANMYAGSTYNYTAASNPLVPTEWTTYSGTIGSGWNINNNAAQFRYGTEYVRILFLLNRNLTQESTTAAKDLKFYNITNPQQAEFKLYPKSITTSSGQTKFSVFSEVGPDNGLIGWWLLNDVNDIRNLAAPDKYGTTVGTPTQVNGRNQLAVEFNGTSDRININETDLEYNLQMEVSCFAWVYVMGNHADGRGTVFTRSSDYYMQMLNTDRVSVYSFPPSGSSSYFDSTSTIPRNTWTHVGWTEANGYRKIYINGELDAEGQYEFGMRDEATLNRSTIGGQDNDTRYFNGRIQQVRLYQRAISEKEVKMLYNMDINTRMINDSEGRLFTKLNEV